MQMSEIALTVNGDVRRLELDPRTSLLDALRETLDLTGTKKGSGRIVNPRLAASQCTGGMVGGIGMARMERTVLDPRDGRPVNAHMADYPVSVNLDIPQLEVHFVNEEDSHVNPLGIKGLSEIALVGMAPAIANAVFHATGKRVRDLPIRIEDVLIA
jgi:xanthine dehydrogenase YagR molybdenum-binding subunit